MKANFKNFFIAYSQYFDYGCWYLLFKFANNFTFGGITGFAVLVAKFTPLSASDFSFVANILLLVVGWIILGKSFAAKTAYSTILLSVTLSLFERVCPMSHPLTNEPLLELIFLQFFYLHLAQQSFSILVHQVVVRMLSQWFLRNTQVLILVVDL